MSLFSRMGFLVLLVLTSVFLVTEAGPLTKLHKANEKDAISEIKGLLKSMQQGKTDETVRNTNGNSLKTLSESFLNKEKTTVKRLQQHYQGVPVFGAHVIVTATEDNVVKYIDGIYAEGLNSEIGDIEDFKTTPEEALQYARKSLRERGKSGVDSAVGKCERIVYVDQQSEKAEPAYQCTLNLQPDEISVPQMIINKKGGVLLEWDLIQDAELGQGPGGNIKIGMYTYGPGARGYFEVQQTGLTCSMIYKDANNTIRVQTINNLNRGRIGSGKAYTFTCPVNNEADVNGGYSSLNDAHHHSVSTYKMFAVKYKDIGVVTFPVKTYAHFSTNYDNAYWDGYSNILVLGDGGTYFHPLVSLDVVAHEICHGVTQFNSNLVYQGESGGINEAFSDMCGIAAEDFQRYAPNWKIGDEIGKSAPYRNELRCLDNPPACGDGRSIASLCSYSSGMNVHYSSGIFNKAFYNIATIPGSSIEIAFRMFYNANRFKWTPTTGFATAAAGVMFFAEELRPVYLYDIDLVVDAFLNVRILCKDSTPTIVGGWDCVKQCP